MQRDVGLFRVDAQQLKAALLPSPTALMKQLSQLLPQAAAQLYNNFIVQIHEATFALKASISRGLRCSALFLGHPQGAKAFACSLALIDPD